MYPTHLRGLLLGITILYYDKSPQRMFSYFGRNLREEESVQSRENLWEYAIHVKDAKAFRIWLGNQHLHPISGIFWHGWDTPIQSVTVLAPDFIIPDQKLYTDIEIPAEGELYLHAGGRDGTITPGSRVSLLLRSDHNHEQWNTHKEYVYTPATCPCCDCGCASDLLKGRPRPPRRLKISFLTDDEANIMGKTIKGQSLNIMQESILIY